MSFFYKKFAERYGCTPAVYRRRLPDKTCQNKPVPFGRYQEVSGAGR